MFDVLVIGTGPAGLAITAACAQLGLNTACLSPDAASPRAWPNTYGVWQDELAEHLRSTLSHTWTQVYARGKACQSNLRSPNEHIGIAGARNLNRAYSLFDNIKLQTHLLDVCAGGSVSWLVGRAEHIHHNPATRTTTVHATVPIHTTTPMHTITRGHTTKTTQHHSRLVIDASGHTSKFVTRPPAKLAYQLAYGVVATFSTPPIAPSTMMLMDFDDSHLPADERQQASFLYAMDLGDGRFFVEETALAARPKLPFEVFKTRLERRLAARGCDILETYELEQCVFPMNPALPHISQPVVGYGAAASMVHPASGYMVGLALRHAPEFAQALANGLEQGLTDIASHAWQHLWPAHARYQQQLYRFGLEAILKMDSPQTQAFFEAFFACPAQLWQGYLSAQLSTAQVLRIMLEVFGRAPNHVRGKLLAAAWQQPDMLIPQRPQHMT
ncbi:MAG: lycopene cyclase family protein [Deinococcota bacterium]